MSTLTKSVNRLSRFFKSDEPVKYQLLPTKAAKIPLEPYVPKPVPYRKRYTEHVEDIDLERSDYYGGRVSDRQRPRNARREKKIGTLAVTGGHAPELAYIDIHRGVVINGQSTAGAPRQTGVTIKATIRVWDEELDPILLMSFFDRVTTPRTIRHEWLIMGRPIIDPGIAVLNRMVNYQTYSTAQNSSRELEPFYQVFYEKFLAVRKVVNSKPFVNGTFLSAHTLMLDQDPEKVLEFAQRINNNEDCPKGTLLWRVIQTMTEVGPNGEQKSITGGPSYDVQRRLVWAINEFIENGNERVRELQNGVELSDKIIASYRIVPVTFDSLVEAYTANL